MHKSLPVHWHVIWRYPLSDTRRPLTPCCHKLTTFRSESDYVLVSVPVFASLSWEEKNLYVLSHHVVP